MSDHVTPRTLKSFSLLYIMLPFLVLMAALYTFVSLPSIGIAPLRFNFYSNLGEAFLQGQTYLLDRPSPRLLAMENPYDASVDRPDAFWDVSLYKNKYYMYFGPVPALFIWIPAKLLFGVDLNSAYLTLLFTTAGTTALLALFLSISMKEGLVNRTALLCCLLSLAYATWLPFMLNHSAFYEVAVAGAYCFNALGLLLLWHGAKGRRYIYLASLCFGLSMGCRQLHMFNAIILAAAWWKICEPHKTKNYISTALPFALPWLVCLEGLMVYNYVRFGSVFETGMRYQITSVNMNAPDFQALRIESIVQNIYYYLFRPVEWKDSFTFPYLKETAYNETLLFGGKVMTFEAIYGIFINSPFSLFVLAGLFVARTENTLLTGIKLFLAVMLCFHMLYFFTTTRYAVDFTPWLMIIAAINFMRLTAHVKSKQSYYALMATGIAFTAYGVFTGVMLGLTGMYF